MSPSKVNRFIDVAEEQGWIERPIRRGSDATKPLEMTATGRQVVAEFKRLCREAVGASRTTAPRAPVTQAKPAKGGKKSLRSRIAESKAASGNLMDVLKENTRTSDGPAQLNYTTDAPDRRSQAPGAVTE